jgi:hypothetical protein
MGSYGVIPYVHGELCQEVVLSRLGTNIPVLNGWLGERWLIKYLRGSYPDLKDVAER